MNKWIVLGLTTYFSFASLTISASSQIPVVLVVKSQRLTSSAVAKTLQI
jgi:hypothetical protein